MNTSISETEIAEVFERLGLSTDEERQRALFKISYDNAEKRSETMRFDIGFNATLPNR